MPPLLRALAAPPLAAAALAAIMLAPTPARADDPLARVIDGRTFDAFVQATLQDYGVPGAVVVVVGADGAATATGYGIRQAGAPGPVDADTRFQIASMSKFVAATAIGTLVDRGIVQWDAPVRRYAPDTALAVSYATENASLRDFLTHRSGLPAYGGDLLPSLGFSTAQLAARARFLAFGHQFRAAWAYSNYGIFLGQHAAAQAAGTTPAALLDDAILRPLGMARSAPGRAALFQDPNRAAAHDTDGSVMDYEDVDAFSGAGAIVSTGADIGRWMRMLLAKGMFEGRRILAEATVDEIFAASMVQGTGGPLHDPNDAAGLGCESYRFMLGRVIEKNGALNGMRTIVTLIPDRGVGIAVFANKQLTVFPEAVRAEFLERHLGPSGQDLQAQIRRQQPAWRALLDMPQPPAAAPPARDPAAYEGAYRSPLYGDADIGRRGAELTIQIGPARYQGRLTHWSGDTYLLRFPNPDITPGLLTFTVPDGAPTATGFNGSRIDGALTTDFGPFERR